MPRRVRLLYSILCLPLFFLAVAPLLREFSRPKDIWWTPQTLLVPVAEGKDRVEIYARGKPLTDLLQTGRLRIAEDGGSGVLGTSEVGLRFNNWDRVRAERLPMLLVSAAGSGMIALLFLLILTGRLAYREERGGPAS